MLKSAVRTCPGATDFRRKKLWREMLWSRDRLLQLKNKLAYLRWLDLPNQKTVCDKRKPTECVCPGALLFICPTEKVVQNLFAVMTYCKGDTMKSGGRLAFNSVLRLYGICASWHFQTSQRTAFLLNTKNVAIIRLPVWLTEEVQL